METRAHAARRENKEAAISTLIEFGALSTGASSGYRNCAVESGPLGLWVDVHVTEPEPSSASHQADSLRWLMSPAPGRMRCAARVSPPASSMRATRGRTVCTRSSIRAARHQCALAPCRAHVCRRRGPHGSGRKLCRDRGVSRSNGGSARVLRHLRRWRADDKRVVDSAVASAEPARGAQRRARRPAAQRNAGAGSALVGEAIGDADGRNTAARRRCPAWRPLCPTV
jgi:hypothetical protein